MGEKDLALVALVKRAEGGDFSVRVTVSCRGTVLSGVMISRPEYWGAVRKLFEEEKRESLEFSRLFDEFNVIESEAAQETALAGPEYLHLADTVILPGPAARAEHRSGPWRCRLDSIDAWAFGETSPKVR